MITPTSNRNEASRVQRSLSNASPSFCSLLLRPRFRRNYTISTVIGDEQTVVLAHVLRVADPVVEMLQHPGIACLLNLRRAVGNGFLHKCNDLRLGLVLAHRRIVAAIPYLRLRN